MAVTRRAALTRLLGGGVALGAVAYGYARSREALGVTRVVLPVSDLPSGLAGLRIGLLTDIHRSEWTSEADVSEAVTLLMGERPDLIVLGGDYVTERDERFVEPAAEPLGRLTAPFGVFGILGNHDDDRDMAAALGARGIQVLRDARTRVVIRTDALELVGIRFWTRRIAQIAPLLHGANGTVVLLAHDPRRLDEAVELRIPLVLSGHTHGGQIVLPVAGAIGARKFPILDGPARRGATSIFVSRGLGTVYVPMRLNCPPEIALLTLRPATHV